MDKHILFVKSEIETTRALKNKDLVSFHKRFNCCFNATVFEQIGIKPGMYAKFIGVDHKERVICIKIKKERPSSEKSKWYKVCNPNVSKYNKYCYIRTTNLVYEFDVLPLGAFEYSSEYSHDGTIYIYINY